MIQVVLVNDQVVVWTGFHVLLEEHGGITVASEAAGGREAVTMVARGHPDVVCMDLWIPAENGLMATRQIVTFRQDGSPAVFVIIAFDLDTDVFGTLEVRVNRFILRGCESEELTDTVCRLAAGYGLVDHTVTRRVTAEFARRHASAGNTTEIRRLTARELEIVKLLVVGMLNTEIATELVVETSIVKSHLTRILSRVGARDRVQAVVWTHRNDLTG